MANIMIWSPGSDQGTKCAHGDCTGTAIHYFTDREDHLVQVCCGDDEHGWCSFNGTGSVDCKSLERLSKDLLNQRQCTLMNKEETDL